MFNVFLRGRPAGGIVAEFVPVITIITNEVGDLAEGLVRDPSHAHTRTHNLQDTATSIHHRQIMPLKLVLSYSMNIDILLHPLVRPSAV